VFEQTDLVRRALERAEVLGEECLGNVGSVFFRIAVSGVRTSQAGQPSPQDIALRDSCREVISKVPAGGTAHRLYTAVLRTAKEDIAIAIQEDDE
jgi:hypothetical protein